MKNNLLYDPSDIESILIHRKFIELNDAERELVMKEISSESEYESLRSTLLKIKSTFSEEEVLTPDSNIKNNLIAQFEARNKKQRAGWLESLFPSGRSILFAPGFQIASIAVLVTAVALVYNFNNVQKDPGLAHSTIESTEEGLEKTKQPVEKSLSDEEDKESDPAIVTETGLLKDRTVEAPLEEISEPSFAIVEEKMSAPKQETLSNTQFDKKTIDAVIELDNKRDNNLMQGAIAEKKSEEQVPIQSITTNSGNASRQDFMNLEDEYEKNDILSTKKSSKSKELPPANGVPLNKTPQMMDLLFTSL